MKNHVLCKCKGEERGAKRFLGSAALMPGQLALSCSLYLYFLNKEAHFNDIPVQSLSVECVIHS